jgi:hypothetical protein
MKRKSDAILTSKQFLLYKSQPEQWLIEMGQTIERIQASSPEVKT